MTMQKYTKKVQYTQVKAVMMAREIRKSTKVCKGNGMGIHRDGMSKVGGGGGGRGGSVFMK